MPHVSKHTIEQRQLAAFFEQMVALQVGLKRHEAKNFLSSLLTETEQVMLTKRCAAILMIHQNISNYKIWNSLKLSPSTVARISLAYENGAYDALIKIFSKKKFDKERFWELIELMSRGGLPSMGKDRWKFLDTTN